MKVKNIAAILALAAGFSMTSVAAAKSCSPQQAEAADAMIDQLDDWDKVHTIFVKFKQCDDGSIAEGISESVARLLVDEWATLPSLAMLGGQDAPFKSFVLRHIDTTLDSGDLDRMTELSQKSCDIALASLCREIRVAAVHAAKR